MSGPMWMPALPPSWERLLGLHLQPIPVFSVLALVGLVGYLVGRGDAKRRGVRWSPAATAAWIAGMVLLFVMTSTGIEGYGMMIFSVHLAQHMVIALIVPVLMALGRPVALVGAAWPESRAFAVYETAVATNFARWLGRAAVRWALFLGLLYGIYFTPLFEVLMRNMWGHVAMVAMFLASGCLFFGPLISSKRSAPAPLAEVFASAPIHALFGLVVLLDPHLLVPFFSHPDPAWGIDPWSDQQRAGAVAWALSELATLAVMVVIGLRWLRAGRSRLSRTVPNNALST